MLGPRSHMWVSLRKSRVVARVLGLVAQVNSPQSRIADLIRRWLCLAASTYWRYGKKTAF
jgi:hypothetical protein